MIDDKRLIWAQHLATFVQLIVVGTLIWIGVLTGDMRSQVESMQDKATFLSQRVLTTEEVVRRAADSDWSRKDMDQFVSNLEKRLNTMQARMLIMRNELNELKKTIK